MVYALALMLTAAMTAQLAPRVEALVAAVRPLLPYPVANADGDLPADNAAESKWFVLWPADRDATRIVVRANPLHPEVQKASAEAMQQINATITAAERRAQAAYDRAIDELKKTGKAGDLEPVTLEDEGAAGERIDADLEVTIDVDSVEPYEIDSSEAPTVHAGATATSWVVTTPANTYRIGTGATGREHFRAAESRVYFGLSERPEVTQVGGASRHRVSLHSTAHAFVVILRGNASLVSALTSGTDWSRLAAHEEQGLVILRPTHMGRKKE
jgi:hypothetical protein